MPPRLEDKGLCVLCVLTFMYCTAHYFTGIFYAVVKQISMLFIGNKDSVFGTFLVSAVKSLSRLLRVIINSVKSLSRLLRVIINSVKSLSRLLRVIINSPSPSSRLGVDCTTLVPKLFASVPV